MPKLQFWKTKEGTSVVTQTEAILYKGAKNVKITNTQTNVPPRTRIEAFKNAKGVEIMGGQMNLGYTLEEVARAQQIVGQTFYPYPQQYPQSVQGQSWHYGPNQPQSQPYPNPAYPQYTQVYSQTGPVYPQNGPAVVPVASSSTPQYNPAGYRKNRNTTKR